MNYRLRKYHLSSSNDSRKKASRERWLISYSDYMTLMFALFVVLYATAIIEDEPFSVLSESIEKIFKITPNQDKAISLPIVASEPALNTANEKTKLNPSVAENDSVNVVNNLPNRPLGSSLEEIGQTFKDSLKVLTDNSAVKLQQDMDWLTIELNSGLLFPSGSASPSYSAKVVIGHIAESLAQIDNLIEIRGYTDDLAINTEIFSSNWQLSAARAASITNLLQDNKIDKSRLSIKAYGENQPVASNETREGRAQNRRVVIAVSKYALEEEIERLENKKLPQQRVSDNISKSLQDYEQMQVIKLPNGGIRITTRRDPSLQNKEKEQSKENK
jgi:chemotaxis protein MotB